jgi:hypothetical protein
MIDLREALWAEAEPRLYISKEQFYEWLEGWSIKPIHIDGDLAFITLRKGCEFHFTVMCTKHRITMPIIRECLQPIIDDHGYADTKTPHCEERQHRFNRRLGWRETGRDEFDIHYRIEKLPHA